jgi:hypothetical protein
MMNEREVRERVNRACRWRQCDAGSMPARKKRLIQSQLHKGSPAAADNSQQVVLLQFFAQGIAIDAEHFSGQRLIAVGARHDCFQYRLFHGKDHHFIDVRRLLLAQIPEIFFKAFLDDVLDIVFAHRGVLCISFE